MENQMNVGNQNTQQVEQNPVSETVITSEKPKVNYLMIGGIVLVCFVIFGFGGYYIGKQSNNIPTIVQNNSLSRIQETNTPVQSGYPSATAPTVPNFATNWKTYTNENFGFSIRYPSTWKSDNNPQTTRVDEQPITLINSGELGLGPGNGAENKYPSHYLGITTMSSKQTAQEYVNTEANCCGDATETLKNMDLKNIKIGNNEAISFDEPGAGGRGRIVVLSNGKYLFLFAFPYNYDATRDPIPNQIITTFRFLN